MMIANLFCKKKTPIVYKNAAYLVAVRFVKLYLLVGFAPQQKFISRHLMLSEASE